LYDRLKWTVHGDLYDSLKWTVHGDLYDSLKWTVHGDLYDKLKWTVHGDLYDRLKWTVHGDLYDRLKWTVHGEQCDSLQWTLAFWGLSLTTLLILPTFMYYEQSTALRVLDKFPSSGGNAWILLLKRMRHKWPFLVTGSFVGQLVPAGIIR
jgi:hypothetical protein